MPQIQELILDLEWWQFYDVAEEVLRLASDSEHVAAEIEALFSSEGSPYSVTTSGIQWRLAAPAEDAVQKASLLLGQAERFIGPAEQWEKAQAHLANRPPDAENCIKDAVGALEGIARLLSGNGGTLGKIITPLAEQLGMHNALTGAVSKLYGYRGDEQGIAHGATQALGQKTHEAELVLHWSAATIIYLVNKDAQVKGAK